MKKPGKTKKRWCIAVYCVLCVVLWGTGFLWKIKILPYTQRWFISYSSFHEKTLNETAPRYLKELPSSAENIRYYYHTGGFDTKTGISFTASNADYEKIKETYLSSYISKEEDYQEEYREYKEKYSSKYGEDEWAWYVFGEKVTHGFLEEEKLDYLEEIFQGRAEEYTVLVFEKSTGGTGKDML